MELEEELMVHSPDFFSRRLLRVRLFCMALVEQLEYGVVCAAQLLPLTDVAQPCDATSDITSGVFNFVLCVHSFCIFFFHLVSITHAEH